MALPHYATSPPNQGGRHHVPAQPVHEGLAELALLGGTSLWGAALQVYVLRSRDAARRVLCCAARAHRCLGACSCPRTCKRLGSKSLSSAASPRLAILEACEKLDCRRMPAGTEDKGEATRGEHRRGEQASICQQQQHSRHSLAWHPFVESKVAGSATPKPQKNTTKSLKRIGRPRKVDNQRIWTALERWVLDQLMICAPSYPLSNAH